TASLRGYSTRGARQADNWTTPSRSAHSARPLERVEDQVKPVLELRAVRVVGLQGVLARQLRTTGTPLGAAVLRASGRWKEIRVCRVDYRHALASVQVFVNIACAIFL